MKKAQRTGITARRAKLLASEKFKAAHAKAVALRNERERSTMCPDGKHDLRKPEHVHSGYLLREGGLLCRTCWIAKYVRKPKAKSLRLWFKTGAKAAKTA